MFIKIAGISAALAGVFVVALEVPVAQGRTPAKLHYDRVAADPAPTAAIRYAEAAPVVTRVSATSGGVDCRAQTWPYVEPSCTSSERRPVRTITIERRDGPNTSTLVRQPVQTP
jgi:hypothetical protein